jgi:hypothetical protein
MISVIHVVTVVNSGMKDRRRNLEIKRSQAVVHYNKFVRA